MSRDKQAHAIAIASIIAESINQVSGKRSRDSRLQKEDSDRLSGQLFSRCFALEYFL